jgi:sugar lactone lactonase YvrE
MTGSAIFDTRVCELGEGTFWHPARKQLFWFDILAGRLLSQENGAAREWQFGQCVSATGWIDRDTLLIASETALMRFHIPTGRTEPIVALEADNPATRSNDGRADPDGGFWIGTMGKTAEPGAGAIYRYFRGELVRLFKDVTIPNSICFDPTRRVAYFADTTEQKIMRQALDGNGWPKGAPDLFLDLRDDQLYPDGSVIDAEGGLWNAQWGAGRVARYRPDGTFDRAIPIAGRHSTCPAFGGPDLSDLFVTTATEGLEAPDRHQGVLYRAARCAIGLAEPRVIV